MTFLDSFATLLLLVPATAAVATFVYTPAWTHGVLRKLAATEGEKRRLTWYQRALRYHLGCSFCQCIVALLLIWPHAAPLVLPVPPWVAFAAVGGLAALLHRTIALCTTCGGRPGGRPASVRPALHPGENTPLRPYPMPPNYRGPVVADERARSADGGKSAGG